MNAMGKNPPGVPSPGGEGVVRWAKNGIQRRFLFQLWNCWKIIRLQHKWGFPKMVVPNNHGFFLLKMIILGCEMGVPPFKETPKSPATKLGCLEDFAGCWPWPILVNGVL